MFNIGWSEYLVIAVIALVAIGPKELPGVLRMVGQWVAKARKMAAEFQGQFQEAMREAEMADLKKSFDEVKEAATGFAGGEVMTSLQKDVNSALNIADIEKPTEIEKPAATESTDAPTEAATPVVAEATPAPAAIEQGSAHEAAATETHHDAEGEVKAS